MADTRGAVLRFVRDYIAEHGYGPTYREMVESLGLTSTSVATYHVKRLVAAGVLKRGAQRRARTLTLS